LPFGETQFPALAVEVAAGLGAGLFAEVDEVDGVPFGETGGVGQGGEDGVPAGLAEPVGGVAGVGLFAMHDGVPIAALAGVDVLRGFVRLLPAAGAQVEAGERGFGRAAAGEERGAAFANQRSGAVIGAFGDESEDGGDLRAVGLRVERHCSHCIPRYYRIVSTALVLSAGGMFAAWEAGVWKVLRDHVQPDMIVGASAGAWNAWAIAGGATAEDLCREWMDPGLRGIMKTAALHAKARELFERFRPRMPLGITLVEVPRLRLRIVRGPEIGWRHLAATASIPLGFPPVEIDGKWYVDGGFRAGLPLFAAEEMGAQSAIALNVLTTWHFKVMRAVVWRKEASPRLAVQRIEPSEALGPLREAVVWNAETVRRWIALGERDAKRALLSITM